jgi:uncharacterized low-complexity protein
MSKQAIRKPLSLVLGAAVVSTMGVAGIANADEGENIFAMQELMNGQLTAGGHEAPAPKDDEEEEGEDKDGEGSCGEGKCGS